MLCLSIGGIVIGLEAENGGPPAAVDGAATAFLVSGGTPDIAVRSAWGDLKSPAEGRKLFDSGGLWELHEAGDQLVFSFSSPVFPRGPYRRASFDRGFRRGVVTLDRTSFLGRPAASPLEYPLDELMVINRLVFEGGVEVHGCGVIDASGDGYLFAGQSGAGKSTIAQLWADAGATVLSDDRVVLRAGSDGVRMHGTPWHGDAAFAEPRAARLSRILLLRQAPQHRIRALPAAQAAGLLFSCAFPVFHSAEALDRTLALLAKIVESVPVDALEFAPTPVVTQFVRDQRL